jgi:hypothetical protein
VAAIASKAAGDHVALFDPLARVQGDGDLPLASETHSERARPRIRRTPLASDLDFSHDA